jgi:hypothetical protein
MVAYYGGKWNSPEFRWSEKVPVFYFIIFGSEINLIPYPGDKIHIFIGCPNHRIFQALGYGFIGAEEITGSILGSTGKLGIPDRGKTEAVCVWGSETMHNSSFFRHWIPNNGKTFPV